MSFLKNLFKYSWYTRSEFKMKDSRIVFEHADTKENFKIPFFYCFYFTLCKLVSVMLACDYESGGKRI